MLVSADWVLPVSGPPIREGAVLVKGAHILGVGPSRELADLHATATLHEFPGCVLTPGFVNCHTHLSLTAMSGILPEAPFPQWLSNRRAALTAMTADDHSASAAWGALECLACGTTTVGDIAYGPEALAAAADAGMGGVFFWEVSGLTPSELPEALAEREFPVDATPPAKKASAGISPDSAYTAGPALLKATREIARTAEIPFALHAAGSPAENILMAGGGGPLEPMSQRLAHGFRSPRSGTVQYLDRLGVLDGAVLAGCLHLRPGEAHRIAEKGASAVLCPRSAAALRNGQPPLRALVSAGATVALGTGLSQADGSLDLLEEARCLLGDDPGLGAARLLRMLTIDGAKALGVDNLCGSLDGGKYADLVLTRIGPSEDAAHGLISGGGRDAVEAVMTAGVWRLREGRHVFGVEQYRQAAESVAARLASSVGD